jgi:hypothetical protein
MWFLGYLVFILAFAFGLHWANCRPPTRKLKAVALVAALALPTAWVGQTLLIPYSRTSRFSTTAFLPDLGIAGYSVCVGLLSAWWLARFPGMRRSLYIALFALSHTFLILVGAWLAVGLSKGS